MYCPTGFADANEAHSIATIYMISQADDGPSGSTGGIPIVFSAADGDKLVIGIDADVLLTNTTYTESQVQELLGSTSCG